MKIATAALLPLLCSAAPAQDAALHATLRDSIDQTGVTYADVWGNGTLGFIGRYGDNAVAIVDVSNPDNISLLATYNVPSPNTGSSAQDVQATSSLMFVGLEATSSSGVDIVDIRTPSSPVHRTFVDAEPGLYEEIHDVFYDGGWLYICNSRDPSLAIIDLRTYDPDGAPASITSWAYQLNNLGDPGAFVHDMTVRNGRLYVSGWGSLEVWDVSNLGVSAPSFLGEARAYNVHSDWPADDGAFVVTCEERTGGAIRLFQLVYGGGAVTLIPRDSFVSPLSGSGSTISAHDPRVVGDRVYVSNYSAGVLVLQVDRTSWTWEKVASYDTSVQPPSGYAGCWGVYPFLGQDRVLAGDLEEGFHVIDFSALEVNWTAQRPTLVAPNATFPLTVRIDTIGTRTISAVTLRTSVDGGAFQSTAMAPQGGGLYTADLPPIGCGSKVDYYVQATATNAELFTSPAGAPGAFFTAYAGDSLTPLFSDDFQANLGWTVSNTSLTSGAWTRGNPVESGAQPDSGDPDTAGANCYITANGAAGGGVGDADVDGGPTRLTSPDIDFSSGDGLIRYERWFFTNGDSDSLVIEVSDDAGASWVTVETVNRKAGGWIGHTFRVSDFVTPTSQVRLRFTVWDNPNDSVTEAGVDTVVASRIECSGPPASVVSRNGTGVNVVCFTTLTLPVLGTSWDTQVSHAHHAGATSTWLVGRTAPSTGPIIAAGEILVSGAKLFTHVVPSAGGADTHSIAIPNDFSLVGATSYTQAVILGGGSELCNALDATIGF